MIFQEAERRDSGFGDFVANLEMILINRGGESVTRQLRSKTLEVSDDGDKSLMIFESPKDIKGTKALTFSHKFSPDDQWIYLPALKRVKRISSANRSGVFMGSEFTYEDLGSPEVEKFTYYYLKDETYLKRATFVVERYPKDEHSGYSRQVVWVDQQLFIPLKIDYYDKGGQHLKSLQYKKYHRYLKRYWRAGEMSMVNRLTGKATRLLWKNYSFRTGLSEIEFNPRNLPN